MLRTVRAVAIVGATLALLTAGPLASSADAVPPRQAMFCRSSAARVALSPSLIVEPVVANPQGIPCVPDEEQLAVLPVGGLTVVEGLGAHTASRGGFERGFILAGGQARVGTAFLFLGGTAITVSGVSSTVTDRCTFTAEGGSTRKISQSSRIAFIQIGNRTITNLNKPQTIDLGALKVHLNQKVAPGVQRAVSIELNGAAPVVLAEVAAANLFPCGQRGEA
jgi:hypothetical protein